MLVKGIDAHTYVPSTEILVRNCHFFLHLTPHFLVFLLEFCENVCMAENWIHGATTQWRQFHDRLRHFDTISLCDGRTSSLQL